MNITRSSWPYLFVCFWILCAGARGQAISEAALARIDFVQNLGSQVPLNLMFQDETGAGVQLGDYFGSKPVILVLGYYGCPMLCTLVLNGLVEGLQDLKSTVGSDFVVVNVSINPDEGPTLAAAKKRTYLKRYGRNGGEAGWHFLTGKAPVIGLLARTVGFQYQFDPVSRQYAHPSGLVILTPQGRVAKYLYGVAFTSRELQQALQTARAEEISSPIKRIILLCFHYNPLHGKYSAVILRVIRLLGVSTILGLAGLIVVAARRPKPA
jgi:protein SCO1/2